MTDPADSATRRRFLATATMTGIAASLPTFTPRLFAGEGDRKETIGYALVGLGRLSTNQLAPGLQKTKHAKLVAVVTGTPAKEKVWADKYGIPASHIYNYETFDKIAENDDVDVIYIVLPNGMHHDYVLRAAKAGKHVLCEKPMANSSQECREMIAACQQAGRKLAIGYRCQFEPHHLECMRIASKGVLGKVRQVDAGFTMRIEDFAKDDPKHWRLEKKLAGGGALMDIGIYALNACRYLIGEEPISITAQEVKTNPEKFAEVDETVVWSMTFPGGATATCSTSYDYNGVNKFVVYAERGQFGTEPAYSYGGNAAFANGNLIEKPQIDQFAAEMDDFALCIKEDRQTRVPGEEGLKDLLAVEAIYESVRTGKAVRPASIDEQSGQGSVE
ncbi:MAG: Gfo/Idh/MocA family oxidoreductase [Planctomycetaceae bacterium]